MKTCVAWMLVIGWAIAAEARGDRPNVLILMTDDLRADAVGALGSGTARTPHLDALCQRGRVFRNAYNLGSDVPAVCLPSRNMFLSGRAYFRWDGPQASADRPNLPTQFARSGYETYHHGKRGNSAVQIQERFAVNKYLQDQADRTSGEPGKAVVDEAIEYLRGRDANRPFLMYLAFSNPHDPRVADARFRQHYRNELMPLPVNFLAMHPFDNGEMTVRDERLTPWPRTPAEIQKHLADYCAVIEGMDQNLGRLLSTLAELDLERQTIVVFTSDHGLALGSHGLMGKQSLYEHSAKAPLVFAGPRIQAGATDALAYLLDVFPTLCDLAGVPVPNGIDGVSMAPAVVGNAPSPRSDLFLAYRDVQRAVRNKKWKLIRYPQIHRTQLFDLENDPNEQVDLSADPRHASEVDRMRAILVGWQTRLGDSLAWKIEPAKPSAWTPPVSQGD